MKRAANPKAIILSPVEYAEREGELVKAKAQASYRIKIAPTEDRRDEAIGLYLCANLALENFRKGHLPES